MYFYLLYLGVTDRNDYSFQLYILHHTSKQVEDLKSIKVSEETYELLADIGKYKESMDDIIRRIATFYLDKSKK